MLEPIPDPVPPGERLLAARDIRLTAGGRTILDGVSLQIRAGEIVTLIGLNGAGKSSLVRVLLGLRKPDGGKVERRPGLRIGYTPQHHDRDPALPLTVERFLRLGASASRAELEDALDWTGAAHILHHPIAHVSGGELHRVMLARALLRKPHLLVLDEPIAGVDVASQAELYGRIRQMRDTMGVGILLVSHDLHMVMAASDHVVCLNTHVCCEGRPISVAQHPAFVDLFGPRLGQELALYPHHHDHHHGPAGEVVADDEAPSDA